MIIFNDIANLYCAGPAPIMGMVFAKITKAYKNLLPGKRNLAKAYASNALDTTFTNTLTTKIHKELGWLPETKFEEGIVKTIQWYLENQAWVEEVTSGDYQHYYDRMYKGR